MAVGQGGREYVAIIEGKQHAVQIEPDGEGFRVLVNGEEYLMETNAYGDGDICLMLNGRPRIVHLRNQQSGSYRVTLGGSELAVEVTDPLAARIGSISGPAKEDGQIEIRSPMPGTVVVVHVAEGEEVDEEAPLVILEAMKMQNALNSPEAGVVREVHVEAGQSVEGDALLLIMDRKKGS